MVGALGQLWISGEEALTSEKTSLEAVVASSPQEKVEQE